MGHPRLDLDPFCARAWAANSDARWSRRIPNNVYDDRALFVAAADDLKEEVSRVGVVGQISNFVDCQKLRTRVGAQPAFQRTRGLLPVQIKQQVGGSDEERGVAGEDRLVQQVLAQHGFAESLRGDQNDILALRDEVEREDPVDGRPMQLLWPIPFEVREGFEAAESGRLQLPFEPPACARIEFGLHERFEQDRRTPAGSCGSRDQVIQILGGVRESEAVQARVQGGGQIRVG